MSIITGFDNLEKTHAADKTTTKPNPTANAKTIIEVKNLVKYYGGNLSLDNVSFAIGKGKIYGLLGPNGAGKTTTMNIITGCIGATSGQVIVNGHDITQETEQAKKSVGYLPEIPPLYPDMTVWEYLLFAAELKKIPLLSQKQQIETVMAMTDIADVAHRLIQNLSKGYKQRVGLAQAILGFPPVLILDEPTVGLDPKQITEIRDLIKQLAQNHTIILSSHILSEVQAVCDYILIIHKGRLVAGDTAENLENSLQGSAKLTLTAKGKIDTVQNILNGIGGITSQSCLNNEDGTVDVYLEYNKNCDLREKIFYSFAANQCPILMMKKSETSLEKIFLELTENDNPLPLPSNYDVAGSSRKNIYDNMEEE